MAEITPGGVPPGKRARTQASTMLLQQWAATQTWLAPPVYEMRLGPTPLLNNGLPVTPRIANMLARANRYADLIGAVAGTILVVEAKVVATPAAISQLQLYVNLAYASPIRDQFPLLPITPVLVWAVDDPIVHQMAIAAGITVEVFSPPWVAAYLQNRFYPPQPLPADESTDDSEGSENGSQGA